MILGRYGETNMELTVPDSLVEEIKAIKVECSFTMRWELVTMYHKIGEALRHSDASEKLKDISDKTDISVRSLERSLQFYNKYPDLALLPEGKNTSWHMIVNKYLLKEPKQEQEMDTFWPKMGCMLHLCKKCIKNNLDHQDLSV